MDSVELVQFYHLNGRVFYDVSFILEVYITLTVPAPSLPPTCWAILLFPPTPGTRGATAPAEHGQNGPMAQGQRGQRGQFKPRKGERGPGAGRVGRDVSRFGRLCEIPVRQESG